MRGVLEAAELAVTRHRMAEPGDTIVVGVSGGPDSVALLHVLLRLSNKWNWKLVAAHVNHGFRPEESAEEAEFVRGLSAKWGISCEIGSYDVPTAAADARMNPQEAARHIRYRFLHETAGRYSAAAIALAHHADDQAETVLHRLIRGTGLAGLGGMAFVRTENQVKLIRPLMRIKKESLLAYCREQQLEYRIDSSNASRKYTRNRLRLDVLPMLAQLNPEISAGLCDLADLAREENAFLEAETERALERLVQRSEREWSFDREAYLTLPVALQRRLIKLILYYLSNQSVPIDFQKVEAVREAMMKTVPPAMSLDLGGGVRFVREYERAALVCLSLDAESADQASRLDEVQVYGASGNGILPSGYTFEFAVKPAEHAEIALPASQQGAWTAVFDVDVLKEPIVFRHRQAGDRLRLSGLNGTKKVKNIFIDEKIPRSERERIPLLVDAEGEVLWIPGIRRSGSAEVTASTRRVLWITARKT